MPSLSLPTRFEFLVVSPPSNVFFHTVHSHQQQFFASDGLSHRIATQAPSIHPVVGLERVAVDAEGRALAEHSIS